MLVVNTASPTMGFDRGAPKDTPWNEWPVLRRNTVFLEKEARERLNKSIFKSFIDLFRDVVWE